MVIMENIGSKSVRDQRNGMIMGTTRKGKSLGTVKKKWCWDSRYWRSVCIVGDGVSTS
jgi:hypothetical protein